MYLRPNTSLQTQNKKQKSTYLTMKSSYLAIQEVLDASSTNDSDEATVTSGNTYESTRIQIMLSSPDGDKSTISLLMITSSLIAALFNKLPSLKVAPWSTRSDAYDTTKLLDNVPSNIEEAEQYIYNFSRFSTGPKGYFRINIFHPAEISAQMIADVGREFNQPQAQSIYLAPSDAISPSPVGVLMGSTETMMIGPDFAPTFQHLFEDLVVGFAWRFIQTGLKGKSDRNQKAIHLETESLKAASLQAAMENFFNQEQKTFFGTNMTFIKGGRYPSNAQKIKLQRYAPIQTSLLGNMIESDFDIKIFASIKILASAPNGKPAMERKMTLMEALMKVQSITPKLSVKGESTNTFFGNLFYAISPNSESGMHTFQYLASNAEEATGVLQGLPFFLKDHFGVKTITPYCRTSHRTAAKNGDWNPTTRTFTSQQDKIERLQFENLEMLAQTSVAPSYIDRNHQRAMTGLQPTDESTIGTCNSASIIRDDDSLSNMTGSTNTSKVKVAEARVAAEVAKQYVSKLQSSEEEIQRLKKLLASQAVNEEKVQETTDGRINKIDLEKGKENNQKEYFTQNNEEDNSEKDLLEKEETSGQNAGAKNRSDTNYTVPRVITTKDTEEQEILTVGDSSNSSSSEEVSDSSIESKPNLPASENGSKDSNEKFSDLDDSISEPIETPKTQFRKRKSPRSISSKSSTPTPRGPRGRRG